MKVFNRKKSLASMALVVVMLIAVGQGLTLEGKGDLSARELKALVANAKTPSDHMKLAHHYTAMAAKHEAEATEHEALAAEYTRNPQFGASKHPTAQNTSGHCKSMAEHCRALAKDMKAMAEMHEEMAKSSGK